MPNKQKIPTNAARLIAIMNEEHKLIPIRLGSKRQVLKRYVISASMNFSISLVIYMSLGFFLSSSLAYAIAYALTILSGSVIHLKITFLARVSRKNFMVQAAILGMTGIAATSIVAELSPIIGFIEGGIAGILFSATTNLLLSLFLIKRKKHVDNYDHPN